MIILQNTIDRRVGKALFFGEVGKGSCALIKAIQAATHRADPEDPGVVFKQGVAPGGAAPAAIDGVRRGG